MNQTPKPGKQVIDDYLKAHGYGLYLPEQPWKQPVKRTGDIVRDYIKACGFGLSKKIEAQD